MNKSRRSADLSVVRCQLCAIMEVGLCVTFLKQSPLPLVASVIVVCNISLLYGDNSRLA